MNILVINLILYTPEWGIIRKVPSIKDTMIHGMCKGFVEAGHRVTLLASEEYKPVESELYDFNVLFFKSKWTSIFKPATVPCPSGLRRYLSDHAAEYDIVISSECMSIGSYVAASVCPEKLIIWQERVCHSKMLHNLPSKIWYNVVCPFAYKNIVGIVPRSIMASEFISKYLKSKVIAKILDHGVDGDKFKECLSKKDVLITSSQLSERKRVDYIIKKFAKFVSKAKYSDYRLLIAGRGNKEEELRQLVKSLGIESKVEFLGFLSQKELNSYVGASKLFMVATRSDLNMVSIPESIVSATPLVMNSIPATSKFVRDNLLGIVKDDWNEDDLAEVVDNNAEYVANCHRMRPRLLNTEIAKSFVDIFNDFSAAGHL